METHPKCISYYSVITVYFIYPFYREKVSSSLIIQWFCQQLVVQAYDRATPDIRGQTVVYVTVRRNENKPRFTDVKYTSRIAADLPQGQVFITVEATDQDKVRTWHDYTLNINIIIIVPHRANATKGGGGHRIHISAHGADQLHNYCRCEMHLIF